MKKKWKSISVCALLFILTLFFAYLFFAIFSNVFVKFEVISQSNSILISGVCGIVVAIIVLIYVIVRRHATKETKFSNWLELNYHKIILWYIILLIVFASIKREIIWTLDELRNTVTLEWCIFAISITIFLVWDALILPRLTEQRPKCSNNMSPLLKVSYIRKKSVFFQNVSLLFNSINLLAFNLLSLIITTGIVYIASDDVDAFNQNATIICLYLCTNALSILFIDIYKQLKAEKKKMLEGMKVTQEDIDEENATLQRMEDTLKAFEAIDKLSNMDEKEKEEIKNKLIKEIVGTVEQLNEVKKEFNDK